MTFAGHFLLFVPLDGRWCGLRASSWRRDKCPRKPMWIDKGLQQDRLNSVASRPVAANAPSALAQYVGCQVRYTHSWYNEKTAVAHHPLEITPASRFCPTDEFVPFSKRPGRTAKAQGPKVTPHRTVNQIPDLCTAQGTAPEIVMLVHKSIPNPGRLRVATRDHLELNVAKLVKGTIGIDTLEQDRLPDLQRGSDPQVLSDWGRSMRPCSSKTTSALRQTASLSLPLAARQPIRSQTRCAKDRLDIDGISSSV